MKKCPKCNSDLKYSHLDNAFICSKKGCGYGRYATKFDFKLFTKVDYPLWFKRILKQLED